MGTPKFCVPDSIAVSCTLSSGDGLRCCQASAASRRSSHRWKRPRPLETTVLQIAVTLAAKELVCCQMNCQVHHGQGTGGLTPVVMPESSLVSLARRWACEAPCLRLCIMTL